MDEYDPEQPLYLQKLEEVHTSLYIMFSSVFISVQIENLGTVSIS